MRVGVNCDMGESFGLYRMGDDEAIMPYITVANVACGFHGKWTNIPGEARPLARRR